MNDDDRYGTVTPVNIHMDGLDIHCEECKEFRKMEEDNEARSRTVPADGNLLGTGVPNRELE